jgi:iron-sulfur cluster assembly protein
MSDAGTAHKVGSEKLISVTERASRELKNLFEKKGLAGGALRVAVIGGGCAGLSYKMDIVEGPKPKDILVESNGVRVIIDPKSALYVSGSQLDFSDDLQNGGFQVTNPNASSSCSCGKSFST